MLALVFFNGQRPKFRTNKCFTLVLLPIEIDKSPSGSGHKYKFSSKGAEPLVNQTLAEKLKSDFGLQLPDIYDPAEEAEFNLEIILQK